MRVITGAAVLMLSAALIVPALIVPALADQSGGTMDSGSVGMGTGASRLDRNAAPNLRLHAGTSGIYHGTSGSDMPRWAGETPSTSVKSSNGQSAGGGQHRH